MSSIDTIQFIWFFLKDITHAPLELYFGIKHVWLSADELHKPH